MQIPLAKMGAGKSGTIVKFLGGHGFRNRLNALGIRLCKKITKVSSMLMRGPVIVDVGHTRVALGHGMARKIIVEVANENTANGQS